MVRGAEVVEHAGRMPTIVPSSTGPCAASAAARAPVRARAGRARSGRARRPRRRRSARASRRGRGGLERRGRGAAPRPAGAGAGVAGDLSGRRALGAQRSAVARPGPARLGAEPPAQAREQPARRLGCRHRRRVSGGTRPQAARPARAASAASGGAGSAERWARERAVPGAAASPARRVAEVPVADLLLGRRGDQLAAPPRRGGAGEQRSAPPAAGRALGAASGGRPSASPSCPTPRR